MVSKVYSQRRRYTLGQESWDAMYLTPPLACLKQGTEEEGSAITLELSGVYGGIVKATIRVLYLRNKCRNYSKKKCWEFSNLANLIIILLEHNLSNAFANSLGLFMSHKLAIVNTLSGSYVLLNQLPAQRTVG